MPRQARLDAPGTLHHVMARGIERGKIFRGEVHCDDFLGRLEAVTVSTGVKVFAWALLPNHFHFQNRYKSIVCAQEVYLLELVRYSRATRSSSRRG